MQGKFLISVNYSFIVIRITNVSISEVVLIFSYVSTNLLVLVSALSVSVISHQRASITMSSIENFNRLDTSAKERRRMNKQKGRGKTKFG